MKTTSVFLITSFFVCGGFSSAAQQIDRPETQRPDSERLDTITAVRNGEIASGFERFEYCREETKQDECKTITRHRESGRVVAINGKWISACDVDGQKPAARSRVSQPRTAACVVSRQVPELKSLEGVRTREEALELYDEARAELEAYLVDTARTE